jgi:nitrite reductase/ring-hydroxylating ferredoxin subunit
MIILRIYRHFILILFFLLTIPACKKEDNSQIPIVPVDFYVYLNQPSNINLNAVGGSVYFNFGYRGIVVYRSGPSTFVAIERTCSYLPNEGTSQVSIDSTGLFLVDASCGSKFSMLDGSVSNGPATLPLRLYATDYDNVNGVVHVSN